MKKIGPRVNEKTEQFLKSNFKSLSAGAEYIIESFPPVLKKFIGLDIKGRFTKDELYLIIDVMNGTFLTPRIAGQHLQLNVHDGIRLDGLAEKWNVDAVALEEKLSNMSTPEIMFLEIWIQGFWEQSSSDENITLEEYVKAVL